MVILVKGAKKGSLLIKEAMESVGQAAKDEA
jgi:hypothetical protein